MISYIMNHDHLNNYTFTLMKIMIEARFIAIHRGL